uniref:Orc1-like AAA ATPase domain-containing protein n=1 Tax=Physcomitrium patens TaxID=3218 RepID=A0A7I4F7I2_PHYPA
MRVICPETRSASHRASSASPKKVPDGFVSEVTPGQSRGSPCSPSTRRSPHGVVQPKTSPLPGRPLRRALLASPSRSGRNVSDGGVAIDSDAVNLGNNGGPQSKTSRSSRTSTLDYMSQIFPGRRNEINQLLNLLGRPCDLIPPLFVYGPAATGKTSIVRETMRVLGRPHAYVSCRSSHTPRLMFESMLNQLLGHVRSASNNYGSARKCERLIDFTKHLPAACAQALSRKSSHDARFRSANKNAPKAACRTSCANVDDTVYLIFDNVELSRGWTGGALLLGALFRLSELTRLSNLGLIFISSVGLDGYQASSLSREPLSMYFRDYNDSELNQILLLQRPNVDLYASFLSAVLKTFSRACRRVTELSRSLEPLYEKYCEPMLRGATTPDDNGKRQRYAMLQPYIRPALSQTLIINSSTPGPKRSKIDQSGGNLARTKSTPRRTLSSGKDVQDMAFEMPQCSKYLLLAAYIASRNAATLDAALFDAGDGARGSSRKRRKNSSSAMERKEAEAHEQQMKGPGSFPLERLLAIFRCIVVESDSAPSNGFGSFHSGPLFNGNLEEAEGDGHMTEELSADVLMQLSTLVSVNLLSKSSTNPLDGNARYRCNVDGNLIQKVARSVQFPLSKYLLHG